jgi:16S rRNA processing protein RimM
VEVLTDRPEERFRTGTALCLEGEAGTLTIRESRPVADGPGWWIRFAEIPDRAAAEALRDRYLEIEVAAGDRVPGTWYWHELVGLEVRSIEGRVLGTVAEVYRAGGAEVFLVRGPDGELDVPGVRGIVTELAPERGMLVVDLDALALEARPVEDEEYVRPRDRRPHRRRGQPRAAGEPAGNDHGKPAAPRGSAPAEGQDAAEGSAPAERSSQAEVQDAAEDQGPAAASTPAATSAGDD